jgi:hypothetical protein
LGRLHGSHLPQQPDEAEGVLPAVFLQRFAQAGQFRGSEISPIVKYAPEAIAPSLISMSS